ncbi:MAG: endo-1,4-beta-xylanase [Bacteroidales bacterium]|nr:endo-1,4-beta-xylanase [Bacteroidales bacterium]
MGQFTFIIPPDLPSTARQDLLQACLVGGYEHAPIPTPLRFEGNTLLVEHDTHESTHILAPWPVAGVGSPMILSGTLREREQPYILAVELARGRLFQIRTQMADWEGQGVRFPPAEHQALRQVTRLFGQAVLSETPEEAHRFAQEALALCYPLSDRLTQYWAEQFMAQRLSDHGTPDTDWGARLTHVPDSSAAMAYCQAFNAVRLVPNWQAIEPLEARCVWDGFDALVDWAAQAGLTLSIGPLIDLTSGTAPAWLSQWDGDLPSLAAFMSDFVETIMNRYGDRVSSWQVFSGLNHADTLGLSEDDRLRLAARLIESARQTAPHAELGIGIALPWGDFLVAEEYTYSPFVFADTLQRVGCNLAGIELELLNGPSPRASRLRTVFDCYRLLDLFANLGAPLELQIGSPPTRTPPDHAQTDGAHQDWVSQTLFLGLSIPQVRAIYWSNWDQTADPIEAIGRGEPDPSSRYAELRQLRGKWLPPSKSGKL